MKELISAAIKAEEDGALAATVFGGFPLADTAETGLSIVSITDTDPSKAQAICDEIGALAWERRAEFNTDFEPLEQSISRAKAMDQWPVLLVDHADNCNTGGTLDTMTVIAEALRQGLTDIAAGPVCDPEAVAMMIEAGVGASVTLEVGGKVEAGAVSRAPLLLTGKVRTISDGRFVVSGPVFTGAQIDLGRTVVLDTGTMELVVSEGRCEPLDLRMFRFVGIEPTEKKFVIIKSKVQYRPTFGAAARAIVEANGTGVCSMDLTKYRFAHIPASTYPLSEF
jgi:microcystin degradation protein MlrC